MSTVRLRRLQADFEKVRDYVNRHPRLQLIQTEGTPPERYQLEYRLNGLRQKGDELETARSHMVELALPLNYPRMPPQCRMLTPVFHPNIAPHAICIGDHWSPGEPLWSIIARIGEMISFQTYNTRSPLNGEAAKWVEEHIDELPLDPVSLMPDEPDTMTKDPSPGTATARAPRAAPSIGTPAGSIATPRSGTEPSPAPSKAPEERATLPMTFACPSCGSTLRFGPEMAGKRVRCPRCQTILRAPESISKPTHE
jgi:ubiquitin-protein ligase